MDPLIGSALIGGGASLIGGSQNAKAANKAAKSQADLYNKWLAQRNAGAQDILGRLQAGGYDPFSKQTLESGSTTNQSQSSYTKTNPFITEDYKPLEGMMRGIMENRLSRGSSLPPGYEASAIRNANAAFAGARAAASNAAARKGLSAQQLFATSTPFEAQRAGKIADIRTQTPLLERQMANEDIGTSKGLTESFGKGTEQRSRSNMTSTTSGWGQQLPDLNSLANLLLPAGPQQTTQSPYSALGAGLQGGSQIAMLLGQLYANRGISPNLMAAGNAAARSGGMSALQFNSPGGIATSLGGQ